MHESVSDDEGTMSRRDDQGGWQWREEVKPIVRNSPLNGFHYPLRSRWAELLVEWFPNSKEQAFNEIKFEN